jgi:hypothetical protein
MKLNLLMAAAQSSPLMTYEHTFVLQQQGIMFYVINYSYSANGVKRNAYKILAVKYCDMTPERQNSEATEMAVTRLQHSKHHISVSCGQ